jgi:sacsin
VSGVFRVFLARCTNCSVSPLRKHLPFNYHTRQNKPGLLLKYAKLKSTCQDQLAPFEGLWGFDSNEGFYDGTIFRFPLRGDGQSSELLESRRCLDASTTPQVFRKTFDEARLALLFLRNITTIDFSVKGSIDCEWKVRRGNWPQDGSFSDWANVIVEKYNYPGENTFTIEQWWRVIEDVRDPPAELQYRHKRRMKNVECGIAALVPQSEKGIGPSLQPLKSKFFNCLPLKFESTLPVQIHATFLLSGDRQNIATEETSQDAGSEWNKWLLQKELPHVYLQFLEDIGRKTGHDVYKYFPAESSGRQHLLSDLIRVSFWENIRSSSCRLFPVIEISQDPRMPGIKHRSNRTAPNLVTFEHAVFDVLEQRSSEALQPLLDGWLDNLVRSPMQLAKHIRRVPGVKVLTPAMLRDVLRSAKAPQHVEKAKQRDKDFLDTLLSFIMPTTTAEVIELDGCPVLPLADGGLGTLFLKSTMGTKSGSNKIYFSADAECYDLFSFASSLLCAKKGNRKFVQKILDSGLLNLKTLERRDVNVMLDCKESWTPESTPKTWLVNFWQYMNSNTQSTMDGNEREVLNLDSLQNFPLLLLHHSDGKETLNSLQHFQNNPVVVRSAIAEHMNIFTKFPGLAVVASGTIPGSYRRAEKSLSDLASMNRFLKSIKLLAKRHGMSVTEFVRSSLNEENIQVGRPFLRSGASAMLKHK